MSAMRPEPAQVQDNDGRPVRFVWRERLYTVLSVVERPGEAAAAAAALGEAARAAPEQHEHEPDSRWRCWRVTAAPGKNVPPVGFRLCQDPVGDRWLLSRDSG